MSTIGHTVGKETAPPSLVMSAGRAMDFTKTIDELENKVDRLQRVVYQLLGGLFNHNNQSDILDELLDMLFDTGIVRQSGDDIQDGNPTTRQGDENEKRLCVLEKGK